MTRTAMETTERKAVDGMEPMTDTVVVNGNDLPGTRELQGWRTMKSDENRKMEL